MFEQDRVNGRFQQRIQSDPAIRACLLLGSHGRATNDPFSDIDALLVYATAETRDDAWRRRKAFIEGVMAYVATQSFEPAPFELKTVYSNGTQLDLRFAVQGELSPSAEYQHTRLIKDAAGWGAQFQAACRAEPVDRSSLTRTELEALDKQFWVRVWEVARQLQRGDASRPFPTYLTLLSETLPRVSAELPPDSPLRTNLLTLSYSSDVRTTMGNLRALVDSYIAARDAINQAHHLQFFPDRGFEQALKKLLDKLD